MQRFETLFLRIYRQLLSLYPAAFRQQFGEEMTETYRLVLRQNGSLMTVWRETIALMISVVREHQDVYGSTGKLPFGRRVAMLMIPALMGCIILLVRPPTAFYLSTNIWLVFAGVSLLILASGWLLERGVTVLALPSLGFMLFIGLRLFSSPPAPGYFLPLGVQIAVPFAALIGVLAALSSPRLRLLSASGWTGPVLALPVTALVISIVVIGTHDAFGQPPERLLRNYGLGALLPISNLSLLILIGLPFARRFGANAVLLLVGYLFFDLLGLAATLSSLDLQKAVGGIFALLFLLVIPLVSLRAPAWLDNRARVMVPVALAYGLIFALNAVQGEWEWTFVLYRTNELLQTLIALGLAMTIYNTLKRKTHADNLLPSSDAAARGVPV